MRYFDFKKDSIDGVESTRCFFFADDVEDDDPPRPLFITEDIVRGTAN